MGVGGLIGRESVQKFVSRAPVVNLVEHGSGHVGSGVGKKLLLVKKSGIFLIVDRQNHGTVHMFNHDFIYHGLVVGDNNAKVSEPVIQSDSMQTRIRQRLPRL